MRAASMLVLLASAHDALRLRVFATRRVDTLAAAAVPAPSVEHDERLDVDVATAEARP